MCGIFAYKGSSSASEAVIHGLKKLEYRGYDSWGILTKNGSGRFDIYKKIGKIGDFKNNSRLGKGHLSFGHTRWATHGSVTKKNAHPQLSCDGKIAIIHNGIIENYLDLKKTLLKKHHFTSETDTEVVAHMIEEYKKLGFEEAFAKTLQQLRGRFAIIALSEDSDTMLAARSGSPLVVGIGHDEQGKDEYFLSSDAPAFLENTTKVIFPGDHEIVAVDGEVSFKKLISGEILKKKPVNVTWKSETVKKGTYPHFMLKEIMEQKDSIPRVIAQKNSAIQDVAEKINRAFGTYFIGCGSAFQAALAGEYIFTKIARKHTNVYNASEFPNFKGYFVDKDVVLAISQSGETADILDAVEAAKSRGMHIISVVNVDGSSLARESEYAFVTNAGPEVGVSSTKAFTAQLALMYLFAYASIGKVREGKLFLSGVALHVNQMLNDNLFQRVQALANKIKKSEYIFSIGRGINYPIAREAALKIKQLSYIHAEGLAGGELKHGSITLIKKGTPCLVFAANDNEKNNIISNAVEIKSRGGYIIGISPWAHDVFDFHIPVPMVGDASAIVNTIPAQLLGYYLALELGLDPDRPRNLAKSVTVK